MHIHKLRNTHGERHWMTSTPHEYSSALPPPTRTAIGRGARIINIHQMHPANKGTPLVEIKHERTPLFNIKGNHSQHSQEPQKESRYFITHFLNRVQLICKCSA